MADRADRFDRSDFEGRPSITPVRAVIADDTEPYDYIGQPGDTLERIAAKWLGDATEWRYLYQANQSRIKDPNVIRPGLKLVILMARAAGTTTEPRARSARSAGGWDENSCRASTTQAPVSDLSESAQDRAHALSEDRGRGERTLQKDEGRRPTWVDERPIRDAAAA